MTGKTGAARIALETTCPVIPVAQWGPQELLPPKSKRPKVWPRKTMQVVAGPPVDLEDLRGRPIDAELLRRSRRRGSSPPSRRCLTDLRPGETPPATPFDGRKHRPTSGAA